MAKRIIVIDIDECIACGNCGQVCPEVFRLNEALEHSEIIDAQGAPAEKILDAMEECPVRCIHWQEEK